MDNAKKVPDMWSLIGGMGAFAAYAMAGKDKTLEEWKSEAEKWEKQTEYAQQALLDVSYTLSDARRMGARLTEEIRITGLTTSKVIRELTERADKAEAQVATYSGDLARVVHDGQKSIREIRERAEKAEAALTEVREMVKALQAQIEAEKVAARAVVATLDPLCAVCGKSGTEGRHSFDLGEGHEFVPKQA